MVSTVIRRAWIVVGVVVAGASAAALGWILMGRAVEEHVTPSWGIFDLTACGVDHRRVLAVLAYLRRP